LFRQGLMRGTVTGGQGNEALIVPLALLADKALDTVFRSPTATLRRHSIWSGDICDHLNQYFANAGSPTKAREGNIHHGDPANRSAADDQPSGRDALESSRASPIPSGARAGLPSASPSSATAARARATCTRPSTSRRCFRCRSCS
jgi:hypothetical protein